MTATIGEERLPGGWQALRLRNERLEVLLLPHKGSEIYELRARHQDVDLLWKAPQGLRPPPLHVGEGVASQATWLDHYGGGWQELFPNGGDACTHAGAPHPFHGEASLVPWDYEIVAGTGGIPVVQLAVRLARSPFRIEKRVWLEAHRAVLHLWERITNEGRTTLPFMWGHHPAYGAPFLDDGCLLEVPAAVYEANEPQTSTRTWVVPGRRSPWPQVARAGGGTVDLSRVPGHEAGVANLGYLLDLADGWYALSNPRLGLGIGLAWPREVFSCLWLWQELGGTLDYPWYGAAYVMGVEPHTSHPGQGLVRAIERGTARTLAPGESLAASLTATLFEPRARVRRVTLDGEVEFEAQ